MSQNEPRQFCSAAIHRRTAIALAAAILFVAQPRARADDESLKQALALEATIQQIVKKAEPSIACILVSRSNQYARLNHETTKREPGDLGEFERQPARRTFVTSPEEELRLRLDLSAPEAVPDSYGSGVVILADNRDQLVLTNYHVVHGATKVFVRLPNTQGSYARIYAADERSDLAVLKLYRPLTDVRALTMGDADDLKKGQFVICISNPYAAGFRDGSPSVAWGMLSNVRRRLPGEPNEGNKRRPHFRYYPTLLQTDMRFPMGCSGGALLDLHGNWIGLTTSIAGVVGGDGAGGYALPLDTRMKRIIDRLRRGLEVEYGFLGIIQDPNGRFGWSPTPNGPAAHAGMRTGDTIIKFDGLPIEDDQDSLLFAVTSALAGTRVHMVVRDRFEQDRELRPVLVKAYWPSDEPVIAANRAAPVFGMRVDYTSALIVPGSQVQEVQAGVVVREVESDSPADKAGIRSESDCILSVNGLPVNTPSEFYKAVHEAGGSLELRVKASDPSNRSWRKVTLP